jgi:PIN domain nuclease of toxin-antitoxin system
VILLDTHAAIWFVTDDRTLGKRSRTLAKAALAESNLAICAISFWEIAMLVANGRLESIVPPPELRAVLLAAGMIEMPLTGDIALLSASLDLHSDPADRFIAATAITHGATLVTADQRLLKWKYPLSRQNAKR